MLNEEVRPTSMVGIKRLAKAFKSSRKIPHSLALDEAARSAGFENFRHALAKLPPSAAVSAPAPRHRLFLSAFWKVQSGAERGHELVWVDLSTGWGNLVTRPQMLAQRSLVRLAPDAEDHLSYRHTFTSQSAARRALCAAVRTFHFMDATKLRPTNAHSRVFPGGRSENAIPGRDHYGSWYDPETKGYVFVDEPYEPAAQHLAVERAAWAARHDYDVVRPDWPGMYNPGGDGGSRLYLVASRKKSPDLEYLAAALDRLPPALLEADWNGISSNAMERFKSPAELRRTAQPALQKAVVPRPPRKTVVRVPEPPKSGRMSIETHEEVGRKLKSVMAHTHRRDGVYKRLNSVRSELDDWIQREYDVHDLPMEQFGNVYYGSEFRATFARSITTADADQHVATLQAVKADVSKHYANWQVKSLIGKVDAAIKSLRSWSMKP